MKIIVTIKQVPNTSEIKIDPVTHTLKREGVPSIINPDDKAALEEALILKDTYDAHVSVICMGPPQAEIALREALAMGVDEAYLLTDRAFAGSDTLATSRILAAAIKKLDYDLIICGRQAIDGDTAQVGPQIAEHLSLPQVTYVQQIEYEKEKNLFTLKRQYEDFFQIIEVTGKLLLSVVSGINNPRYMNVGRIIQQAEKPINIVTFKDLELDETAIGLKGSPTKVKTTFTKQLLSNGEVIYPESDEAAQIILDSITKRYNF
jgi:electron transfer flavoprotein beta subunit